MSQKSIVNNSSLPPLIDIVDYIQMEEMKSNLPKRLYEVVIMNLPLYSCMGDVFELCRSLNVFVAHVDFVNHDRDPRYPPFAVVHISSEARAKKLAEELNGLFYGGKRLIAETIYHRKDLIRPRQVKLN